MNTSGLCKVTYFARDLKYSWFHEPSKNWIYYLYSNFIINNWYIESIYNLGDKTILNLLFNRITVLVEYKTEKRNSQCEHGQPMQQTRSLFCTCDSGAACCHSQHHNNELHGQESLAAVNQILCRLWGYEWLQKSKDSLMACFENVNIIAETSAFYRSRLASFCADYCNYYQSNFVIQL